MLNITSIASFYGRKMEDHSTAISVALALVSSPLDYVNSILSGSPLKHIARFQHALARVILQQRSCARSTSLMQQLHWLPIDWRIRFKLATLTYKGRPPYLADLIQFHSTPKSTRSSSTRLLFVPHHNLSFGSQASASLPLKFGIPYLFTSGNHNHSPLSDVI